jgi:hypothetical protein
MATHRATKVLSEGDARHCRRHGTLTDPLGLAKNSSTGGSMSTNIHHVGVAATNVADRAHVQQVCSVLHCTDEAGSRSWPTESALGNWPITWAVCSYHYWQLDSGKACAKVNEDEPHGNRWLLMDDEDEVESRIPPTQATRIAVSA